MSTYRVETNATGPLVPGERVTGTCVGYHQKSGRVAFRSTWDGVYVGVQEPDPTDPFIGADGSTDAGETIHLFREGHINGMPQAHLGFPVGQF